MESKEIEIQTDFNEDSINEMSESEVQVENVYTENE